MDVASMIGQGIPDPAYDSKSAYQPQEDGDDFFDDGREIELLHFVYEHPELEQLRNNPAGVIAAIDEYARTRKYLMNVGDAKGKIVCDIIAQKRPQVLVELGGYVAYSTILFGDALRRAGGPHARLYSLERSPEFAAVIMALVDLAGLSEVVRVVIGPSADSIQRLHANRTISRIDLLFLDHLKPAYTPDLKLCESLQLIGPDTTLVADNVIKPGNPPYLEYVRSSVQQKRDNLSKAAQAEGSTLSAFSSRWSEMYKNRVSKEVLNKAVGDPDLVYESKMIESFEPTGIKDALEITHCLGREASDALNNNWNMVPFWREMDRLQNPQEKSNFTQG